MYISFQCSRFPEPEASMECWCNDTVCPPQIWHDLAPEWNPFPPDETPATDRLNNGTATESRPNYVYTSTRCLPHGQQTPPFRNTNQMLSMSINGTVSENRKRHKHTVRENAVIYALFAKLRWATTSFVMSFPPSVHLEQLGSHWTNFHEIWYFKTFRKSVEKFRVLLNLTTMTGTFHEDVCIVHSL